MVCGVAGMAPPPNSSATLKINSNTPGQLTLDGRPVIALSSPRDPHSTARRHRANSRPAAWRACQSPVPVIPPNLRDYLECYTASAFRSGVVDNATNQAFNDQVVAIGAADLMPALEAAIAKRIERDVIPELKRVYATPTWGLSAEHAVHPFAAPFGDPGTSELPRRCRCAPGPSALQPDSGLQRAALSALARRLRRDARGRHRGARLRRHRIADLRLGKSGRAAVRRAIRKKRARTVAAGPHRDERHFHERRDGLRALDPEKLEVSARSNVLFGSMAAAAGDLLRLR